MRITIISTIAVLAAITTSAEARRASHQIDCDDKRGCFARVAEAPQARVPRPAPSARARHHRAKPAKQQRPVSPLVPAKGKPELRPSLTAAPAGVLAKLETQADKPLAIMVDKAREYVGKTARQLGLPNSLWCSDFVNMITGGGTHDRMARSWLQRPRMERPELGAIVVFWRRSPSSKSGHVGVLTGWDKAGNPIVVAGNAGGNRVRESRGRKDRVLAYVMPPLPKPRGVLEAGGPWVSWALS